MAKTRTQNDKVAVCSICRKQKQKQRMILVNKETLCCRRHHGVIKAGISFLDELLEENRFDESAGGPHRLYLLMTMSHAVNALPERFNDWPFADALMKEAKYYLFSHSSAYSEERYG